MNSKRIVSHLIAATVVTAAVVSSSGHAFAAPAHQTSATQTTVTARHQATANPFLAAVHALQPYVSRQADHTFAVNAPASVTKAIAPDVYSAVLAASASVNAEIRSGVLNSTATGVVYQVGEATYTIQDGRNAVIWHWYGPEVDLNGYWTNKLLGALNAGAGAAALAAILAAAGLWTSPGSVPLGVTSAILWLGAGVIQFCSNANGVKLFLVPIAWIPWCTGQ